MMVDHVTDYTFVLYLDEQNKNCLFMMALRASISPAEILEHLLFNTFKHVREHPKPRPMDIQNVTDFELPDIPELRKSAEAYLDPDSSRKQPGKDTEQDVDSCNNHTEQISDEDLENRWTLADEDSENHRTEADDDLAK